MFCQKIGKNRNAGLSDQKLAYQWSISEMNHLNVMTYLFGLLNASKS